MQKLLFTCYNIVPAIVTITNITTAVIRPRVVVVLLSLRYTVFHMEFTVETVVLIDVIINAYGAM